MIKRRKKKPNWRLIRMRGKQSLGTKDYEEVYPKKHGWICVIGRVGERRHELGLYDTEAEAKAEEETWRAMRLSSKLSKSEIQMKKPCSTESNAMTPLDQALENHMSRFNVQNKKIIIDNGPAILARFIPPTMTDGSDDLIKAVTNCEAAFAELRRALVFSSERLGQQTMSPPVNQAKKPTVTE